MMVLTRWCVLAATLCPLIDTIGPSTGMFCIENPAPPARSALVMLIQLIECPAVRCLCTAVARKFDMSSTSITALDLAVR